MGAFDPLIIYERGLYIGQLLRFIPLLSPADKIRDGHGQYVVQISDEINAENIR